jgi:hypothetical protein
MDKRQDKVAYTEVNAVSQPSERNLVTTELQLQVWDCNVDILPEQLTAECEAISLAQRLYYPYWRLKVDVEVKALFLPPRQLEFFPSVDAVTNRLCVIYAGNKPSIIDGHATPTYTVPSVITMEDIDNERVLQAMRLIVGKRLRSWSNVHLEIQRGSLIHKRIDVYAAVLHSGKELLIALDTISGECGIIDTITEL